MITFELFPATFVRLVPFAVRYVWPDAGPCDGEISICHNTLGSATLSAAPESIAPLISIQPICSKLFSSLISELLVANWGTSVLSKC